MCMFYYEIVQRQNWEEAKPWKGINFGMIINLFIKHIKLNYIKQHSRVIDLAHHLLILKDYIKKKIT
jgi:uncharacterized membrane protein YagU involved in acid resistance